MKWGVGGHVFAGCVFSATLDQTALILTKDKAQ
jgi:hypothetical protein